MIACSYNIAAICAAMCMQMHIRMSCICNDTISHTYVPAKRHMNCVAHKEHMSSTGKEEPDLVPDVWVPIVLMSLM